MSTFDAFVDDASSLPPGEVPIHEATAAFAPRAADAAVGAFVIRDTDVPLVRGFAGPLAVVVTGGAGQVAGPAGLCTKLGLDLGRIQITLRDLDDLPGNARRVVAAVDDARAAGALGEDTAVHVELPATAAGAGWLAAADEVAAADLRLTLPAPPDGSALAGWIDAALDRELPFTCRGLRHAVSSGSDLGVVNVLAATQLLFDGEPDPLAALTEQDSGRLLERAGDRRAGQALVRVLRVGRAGLLPARAGGAGAVSTLFGLDNLPYGVFSVDGDEPRVGVRLHDTVVDAHRLTGRAELGRPDLGAFMAQGPSAWQEVREELVARAPDAEGIPLGSVTLHRPFEVADYVDFYCSLHHATNVGHIFRPDGEPLSANWRHLPIGYHGRAGTVVISGTDVVRPRGQRPESGGSPSYGATRRLDIEAELGFVVGVPTALGTQVPTADFAQHVFGVTPLNDWSARDIQAWESQPLGPFLGKSFATSISPWITPLDALSAARVALPGQDPAPLDYLRVAEPAGYDIAYEVVLNGEVVSRPPYASTYWSPAQMLAHLTVNGASLRTGDLFGSGTISGPERDQRGSLLELSWGGREPFGDGRTFLEDGDVVTLRATAPGALGGRIALGEVTGTVLPAAAGFPG